MKYVDEFRDGQLARILADRIARTVEPGRKYRFMEFCGGHTHAISRYGVTDLLPASVEMVHGPGCPVCVLPIGRIDNAIALALEHGAIRRRAVGQLVQSEVVAGEVADRLSSLVGDFERLLQDESDLLDVRPGGV